MASGDRSSEPTGKTLVARYSMSDAALSEALHASLWELGCTGVWEQSEPEVSTVGRSTGPVFADTGVTIAYFECAPEEAAESELRASLERIAASRGCLFEGLQPLVVEDWMATHRRLAQPVRVGSFVVDPREPEDPAEPHLEGDEQPADLCRDPVGDRGPLTESPECLDRWIRVPARRAFGTGSHETTRLVLRLLQQIEVRGLGVLDVGCGTGVLSFAAYHLGARSIVGYDVDPVAAVLARENRLLNGLEGDRFTFYAGTERALRLDRFEPFTVDLILANVLPERLEGAEPRLARLLTPGGTLLLSGLLSGEPPESESESSPEVAGGPSRPASTLEALARWRAAGIEERQSLREGEWMAVRLTSSPRPNAA